MNLLGVEYMTGTNIKADLNMGITLLEEAANQGYLDAQYNLGNYYFIYSFRDFLDLSINFMCINNFNSGLWK